MNINATLLGQMITFALFVWFTMKYVWPPLIQALKERQAKIEEGLAAAERGARELEDAKQNVAQTLSEAKAQAMQIIEQANKRANQLVEESQVKAREEGDRIITAAKAEIERELNTAKAQLREQVASLAVAGAEKILEQSIDDKAHQDLLNKLAADI